MDKNLKKLLDGMEFNQPSSREILTDAELKLGIKFPDEYIKFMMETNGAEGTIGNSYLAIWSAEQIVQLNVEYAVSEFTPGLVYFGSDGGGIAYAFDKRLDNTPIVEFPFESIHIEDVKLCGKTFTEFLQYLHD